MGVRVRIELPQVGESVTEGVIGKWLKSVGDPVEKYDPLVEVVTDKVNMEMPSPVSGVLTHILAQEGETVPMGAPIAEIEIEDELPAQPEPSAPAAPEPAPAGTTGVLLKDVAPVGPTGSGGVPSAPESQPAVSARQEIPSPSRGKVRMGVSASGDKEQGKRRRYSPVVMRLAEQHSLDLSLLDGTGIGGRVTKKDVLRHLEAAPAAVTEPAAAVEPAVPAPAPEPQADESRLPLTPIRRLIAANMTRSATETPQAWSITEVDVSGLVARREALKDGFREREGVNLTYLPFVLKAVAEALKENPLVNSSWGEDAIILKRRVNIGIAVAAPAGLIVPVLHDADALSVSGLARRLDDLTRRARAGELTLDEVQGGTFTLNNTGALGSVASQPIINHPQAAILTTEAIVKRPVVVGDGIAIRSMMNICFTFDHRIMDGAEASAFTNAVKHRLEAIGPQTGVY